MSAILERLNRRCGSYCTPAVTVTWAIHLDLVMCALTVISNSARRSMPVLIICDNGKAFEAAATVIQDVVSSPEVQQYLEGIV